MLDLNRISGLAIALLSTSFALAQTYSILDSPPEPATHKAIFTTETAGKTLAPTKHYSEMPMTGLFDLTFAPGYSPEAQEAVMFSAGILSEMFNLTDTVEIMCNWNVAANANNLGSCGADAWHFVNGAWTTQALAKQLVAESSLTNDVTEFDLTLNLNAGRTDWYFGTDGSCPATDFDLATTAMHEILHGMGWGGVFGYVSDASGVSVSNWVSASTYDNLVTNGSGTLITNLTQTQAANAMVNQVQFSGATAVSMNSGTRPELYAPATWDGGSSYSHLDESTFATGTENSLMTPFGSNGEVNHTPGPVGLAVMGDQGWSVNIVFGCTDPEGCNYDDEATFDDGSCITTGKTCMDPDACNYDLSGTCHDQDLCTTLENTFLPTEVGGGPVIYACTLTPPSGYEMVTGTDETYCVAAAAFTVPSCLLTNWDQSCVNAYNACFYGPVMGCTDPLACNFDETANTDDGTCQYGDWILPGPFDGFDVPAFPLDCDVDGDAFLADCILCTPGMVSTQNEDETACVLEVVQADNYCLLTDWDNVCQDLYEACLPPPVIEGCMNPLACNFNPDATVEGFCFFAGNYYLPTNLTAGLPIDVICTPFDQPGTGYVAATSHDCVQLIVTQTPSCGTNWDSSCQSAYENCISTETFGCTDPFACNYDPAATADDWSCIPADFLLIPTEENVATGLPLLPFCGTLDEIPSGYTTGYEECIMEVALSDSYCIDVQWDALCQAEYLACVVPGCTNFLACNYNPAANFNDGSCLLPGLFCDDGDDCTPFSTVNSSCECAGYVLDSDDDGICDAEDCQPADPGFPDVYGNCEVPVAATCDDPTAFNYDPNSQVSGLCVYRPEACNHYFMIEPNLHIGALGGAFSNNFTPLHVSDEITPDRHLLLSLNDADSPAWDGVISYTIVPNQAVTIQFSYALDAGSQEVQPFYRIETAYTFETQPEVFLPTDQLFNPSFDFLSGVDLLPAGQITPGDLYTFPPYHVVGLTNDSLQVPDVPYQAVITVEVDLGQQITFGFMTDLENTEGRMLVNSIIHDFDCISGEGCMYDEACNYYGLYEVEDGSCEFPEPGFDCDGSIIQIGFPGCTYSDACNYDDDAEFDDGSCTFPTPGYDCADNAIGGVYEDACPADVDEDGTIGVSDLLELLGEFGEPCAP